MPEIKKEYPEGLNSIERTLIEMLSERRSFCDYRKIGQALSNVRFRAKQMQKEQETIHGDRNAGKESN